MDDYERERAENIAKNKALLASLQLDESSRRKAGPAAVKTEKAPAPKKKSTPRVKKADLPPVSERTTRSSGRLKQQDPDSKEAKRAREEEEAELAALEAERKKAKHETRPVIALSARGAELAADVTEKLKNALKEMTSKTWARTVLGQPESPKDKKRSNSPKKETNGSSDYTDLRKIFDAMELRSSDKIVPDRIYSMIAHPTTDKDLLFIGDKGGHLGIYDASAQLAVSATEEVEEEDTSSYVVKAHASSTISCLRLDPVRSHVLYTGSYDCTMRKLNFETGIIEEVIDVDKLAAETEGEGEALISGFDLSKDGNIMWVSDNRGGILHRDLREAPQTTRRWFASKKKIGCLSLNPANENYLITSHLERTMQLWDVRKLQKFKSSTSWEEVEEGACVASYSHSKACSSANFDLTGTRILTTSYDNTCCVWNFDPSQTEWDDFNPNFEIAHNNQTGRYVSVFKANWANNPYTLPYFSVGNMDHCLDLYSEEGELLGQLSGDGCTATPAVTACHPTIPGRAYGGQAFGKVYVWSTP